MLTNILLAVVITLMVVGLLIGIVVLNWLFQMANKIESNTAYMASVIQSNQRMERAFASSMNALESILDMMHGSMANQHMQQLLNQRGGLRNATFFRTEDGKIIASNIEEFISKLEQSEDYKHLAENLRNQLEEEIKNEEEDGEEDNNLLN
jgi:Tfp pilus assembly protein PilE